MNSPFGGGFCGSFVGLGPLKDICLLGCVSGIKHELSRLEFLLANKAELLELKFGGNRGGTLAEGKSRLGGKGGGEVPSLGGNSGALGACLAWNIEIKMSNSNKFKSSKIISATFAVFLTKK